MVRQLFPLQKPRAKMKSARVLNLNRFIVFPPAPGTLYRGRLASAISRTAGKSYEVAMMIGVETARLGCSYFRLRFTDMLDFVPESFTNVNGAAVRAAGVKPQSICRWG